MVHMSCAFAGAFALQYLLKIEPLAHVDRTQYWKKIVPLALRISTPEILLGVKENPTELRREKINPHNDCRIMFCTNIVLGNISLRWVPVSFMQTVKVLFYLRLQMHYSHRRGRQEEKSANKTLFAFRGAFRDFNVKVLPCLQRASYRVSYAQWSAVLCAGIQCSPAALLVPEDVSAVDLLLSHSRGVRRRNGEPLRGEF